MGVRRWRWDKERQELYEVAASHECFSSVQILRPLEPYQSPVSGEVIRGRRDRERDLVRHGCIDHRDAPSPEQGAAMRERNRQRKLSESVDHAIRELVNR